MKVVWSLNSTKTNMIVECWWGLFQGSQPEEGSCSIVWGYSIVYFWHADGQTECGWGGGCCPLVFSAGARVPMVFQEVLITHCTVCPGPCTNQLLNLPVKTPSKHFSCPGVKRKTNLSKIVKLNSAITGFKQRHLNHYGKAVSTAN